MLFLAPVSPWSRESGSSLIIADLLEELAAQSQFEILAVFLRHSPVPSSLAGPNTLQQFTLGLDLLPRWRSLAQAMIAGANPMRLRFNTARASRVLVPELRRRSFTPSLVHVEHLPLVELGESLARTHRAPLVLRSHNNESELLGRRLRIGGALRAGVVAIAARDEASAIARCDLTLCISESDLRFVEGRVPGARAEYFPCTLSMARYRSPDSAAPHTIPRIAFVGGLDWGPNEVGLRWFVDRVWPLILSGVPDARLSVLARGASQRRWLTDDSTIDVLESSRDARTIIGTSSLTIAPLLQGGGVRIKIPESLALGTPVVATTIGAEGHVLKGVTRADSPQDFAAACCALLRSPASHAERVEFRRGVEAQHSAATLATRLVATWASLIASQDES